MFNARWLNHFLHPCSWLTDRQSGVQFLLDLTVTYAFPAHTSEFALQVIDLT